MESLKLRACSTASADGFRAGAEHAIDLTALQNLSGCCTQRAFFQLAGSQALCAAAATQAVSVLVQQLSLSQAWVVSFQLDEIDALVASTHKYTFLQLFTLHSWVYCPYNYPACELPVDELEDALVRTQCRSVHLFQH